jgi:hypothetical protein
MIKNLVLIALYPFWFATCLGARHLVNTRPKFGLVYAGLAYTAFAVMHWGFSPNSLIGILINWLIVVWLCKPRYQVIVLLAWAATDVLYLVFGWHSRSYDWVILAVYAFLSITEPKTLS